MGKGESEIQWYPLRVYYSNSKKILELESVFNALGIETFMPRQYHIIKSKGKEYRQLKPLLNDLIFIHTTEEIASRYIQTKAYVPAKIPNVSFIFRKLGPLSKGEDKILIVPERQMANFRRTVEGNEQQIVYLDPWLLNGKTSRKVVVTAGKFKDIEGEMIRIHGNRQVVVRLLGFAAAAVAYIPLSQLCFLEENK